MKKFSMDVMARTKSKTTGAKKVRNEGFIPAVAYGPDYEPLNLAINFAMFDSVSHRLSNTTPITLKVKKGDGQVEELLTYLKNVQRHKVNDRPIHMEFYVPSAGRVMNIEVPINMMGHAIGVEQGGVLEHHYEAIPIEALPKDIPDEIKIDISGVELDDYVKVSDIDFPEGVKVLLDENDILISVLAPREEPTPEPGEEGEEELDESAEPEVIGEDKEEEAPREE